MRVSGWPWTFVVLAFLTATGCGSATPVAPAPQPTPAPSLTPPPVPEPTPTPTPAPSPSTAPRPATAVRSRSPTRSRRSRLTLRLYTVEDGFGRFISRPDPLDPIPVGWYARIDVTAKDEFDDETNGERPPTFNWTQRLPRGRRRRPFAPAADEGARHGQRRLLGPPAGRRIEPAHPALRAVIDVLRPDAVGSDRQPAGRAGRRQAGVRAAPARPDRDQPDAGGARGARATSWPRSPRRRGCVTSPTRAGWPRRARPSAPTTRGVGSACRPTASCSRPARARPTRSSSSCSAIPATRCWCRGRATRCSTTWPAWSRSP